MKEVAKEHAEACHRIYQLEGDGEARVAMEAQGIVFTQTSEAEFARVQQIAAETVDKDWLEEMAKLGLPGQEALDTYLKLEAKYRPLNPFK